MNIKTVNDTDKWNYFTSCPANSDADNRLREFGTWRAGLPLARRYGLWHLLTNCWTPSGTYGLAYLAVTCYMTSPNSVYGVGWSSWYSKLEFMWMTVAHEMGHNFGAQHTFTGTGKKYPLLCDDRRC